MILHKKLLSQIKDFAVNSIYRLNCSSYSHYGFNLYKIDNRLTWEGEYVNNLTEYDYIIDLKSFKLIKGM